MEFKVSIGNLSFSFGSGIYYHIKRYEGISISSGFLIGLGRKIDYALKNVYGVLKAREDNIGTQQLANIKVQLVISRKKHIGTKYRWFRSHIKPNLVEINYIDKK